jgi:hypothetical protein
MLVREKEKGDEECGVLCNDSVTEKVWCGVVWCGVVWCSGNSFGENVEVKRGTRDFFWDGVIVVGYFLL